MAYIPGQKDQLFEAVRGVITGRTEEGHYARKVLGYDPIHESVRVSEVPLESRESVREGMFARMGRDGPPGWKYGQRVYYGDQAFRVESFQENSSDFYMPLRLTLVSDDFTQRVSGVEANYVTYPTHTTAIGEDVETLGEARTSADMTTIGGRAARMALDFIESKLDPADITPQNKAKLMRRLDKAMNAFIIELVDAYKGLGR